MKIKTLLILTTLSLQGCFYQVTSVTDIKAAQDYCKDKGGVNYIRVEAIGNEYAYCNDDKSGASTLLDTYIKQKYLEGEIL